MFFQIKDYQKLEIANGTLYNRVDCKVCQSISFTKYKIHTLLIQVIVKLSEQEKYQDLKDILSIKISNTKGSIHNSVASMLSQCK